MTVKTLTIDGKMLTGVAGQSIFTVAWHNDIKIPRLCHLGGVSDVGACRLCLVEVEGRARLQTSCMTEVEEGMVVHTETPQLREYRKLLLELLFAEGNHVCAVCVSNGHCELQAMAQEAGVDHVRVAYRTPTRSVDLSHERYGLDLNRCISCTRCVRTCDEVEGAHVWDMAGRGEKLHLVADLAAALGRVRGLHRLRQVRAGLPDRRALREGRGRGPDDQGPPLPQVHRLRPRTEAVGRAMSGKVRLATVWLGGCSGCHMSFLDLDERLIELAAKVDLLASPLVDTKTADFPEVDVTLVEGAVVNEEHLEMLHRVRERSKVLVAFGDCAVTGNVSAMRNVWPVQEVFDRAYRETSAVVHGVPSGDDIVPRLLPRVMPLHEVVKVDLWLQGCPPSADRIWEAVTALLEGRVPQLERRFG